MKQQTKEILAENRRRHESRVFDPLTGLNSPGKRVEVDMDCPELGRKRMWLPESMLGTATGQRIIEGKGVTGFARERGLSNGKAAELFELTRLRHDFPYWAAKYGIIRPKRGGENRPLILNSAQRKLISRLEEQRTAGKPIRIILLKARQWGGSTAIQLYSVWLQLTRGVGLNSLIVAHQNVATEEIRAMMKRVVDVYPEWLLCVDFEAAERGLREDRFEFPKKSPKRSGSRETADDETERKSPLKPVGRSGNTWHLPARNCDFKIGTAERPDSSRGGSYSLVHLSEVGIWRKTDGKTPAEIVISATSGVLAEPGTMIVLESTAKGRGTYFHKEYKAAARGEAQWAPVFVAWFDDEKYELPLEDAESFADTLINSKESGDGSERRESGRYLWKLWESGATLEAINWYMWERRKYDSHSGMASEYPSDDDEAFASKGTRVFSEKALARLEEGLREPKLREYDNCVARIWSEPESAADYLVVYRPGEPESGIRTAAAVLDITDPLRPRPVAETYGEYGIEEIAGPAFSLSELYGSSPIAVTADTALTMEVGHADYAAAVLDMKGAALFRPAKGANTVRIDRDFLTAGTDTLRALVNTGRWREPSREALEQMRALESDPESGFGSGDGTPDDLVRLRAAGVFLAAFRL